MNETSNISSGSKSKLPYIAGLAVIALGAFGYAFVGRKAPESMDTNSTPSTVPPTDESTDQPTPENTADTSGTTPDTATQPNSDTAAVAPTPAPTPAPVVQASYKNGSYTAVGAYTSPAGSETIGLSITLKDGTITAASMKPQATNDISSKFQKSVADAISTAVVGKKLADFTFDKIAGASLTTIGLQAALDQIKTKSS